MKISFYAAVAAVLVLAEFAQVQAAIPYRRSMQRISISARCDTDSNSTSDSSSNANGTSSSTSNSNGTSSSRFGLPSGGLKTTNGIPMLATLAPWQINSAFGLSSASMSVQLHSSYLFTGFKSDYTRYGWYAQITGSTWDGSQLLSQKQDIVNSKAVFRGYERNRFQRCCTSSERFERVHG